MAFLSNVKIRVKLIGAFAVVLAASLGLGLFAIDRLGAVNEKAALIRDDYLASVKFLGEVSTQTERARLNRAYTLLAATPELEAKFQTAIVAALNDRDKAWKSYELTVDSGSPEGDAGQRHQARLGRLSCRNGQGQGTDPSRAQGSGDRAVSNRPRADGI
jgi:hypothetical protein